MPFCEPLKKKFCRRPRNAIYILMFPRAVFFHVQYRYSCSVYRIIKLSTHLLLGFLGYKSVMQYKYSNAEQ